MYNFIDPTLVKLTNARDDATAEFYRLRGGDDRRATFAASRRRWELTHAVDFYKIFWCHGMVIREN